MFNDYIFRSSVIEQEELISTLVHNFLIPETEKVQVRKRFKLQQEKYLRAAHASIYDHQETEEIGPDIEFKSDLSESIEIGGKVSFHNLSKIFTFICFSFFENFRIIIF